MMVMPCGGGAVAMTIVPASDSDMCAGANSADVDTDADIGARRGDSNWNRKSAPHREAQRYQHFSCACHFCSVSSAKMAIQRAPVTGLGLSKIAHACAANLPKRLRGENSAPSRAPP